MDAFLTAQRRILKMPKNWVFVLSFEFFPWVLSFFLSFDIFFHVFLIKLVIFHTKTSESFKKVPTFWALALSFEFFSPWVFFWTSKKAWVTRKPYLSFFVVMILFLTYCSRRASCWPMERRTLRLGRRKRCTCDRPACSAVGRSQLPVAVKTLRIKSLQFLSITNVCYSSMIMIYKLSVCSAE